MHMPLHLSLLVTFLYTSLGAVTPVNVSADGAPPCVLSGEGLQEFVVSLDDPIIGNLGSTLTDFEAVVPTSGWRSSPQLHLELDGCSVVPTVDDQGNIVQVDLYPSAWAMIVSTNATDAVNWDWERAQEISRGFMPYDSELVGMSVSLLPLKYVRIDYQSPALAATGLCGTISDSGSSGEIAVFFFLSDVMDVGQISLVACPTR